MELESRFNASYERLVGQGVGITERGHAFFSRFYENFLSRSPQARRHFANTDMDRQVQVLQKGMFHLICFYLLKEDNDFLRSVARTHSKHGYDIEPELYDEWLEALLETVVQMDPEYEATLQLAWRIVMTPGILYLKHYYETPPP